MNSVEGGAAPVGDRSVPSSSGASPGGWTAFPIGEESMPARGGACEVRRAAIGGVVVCGSCWCAMWGPGGRAPPPTCATSGPRGEGVPLAEGRGDVGVRDRGAALSLSPALSRGDATGERNRWEVDPSEAGFETAENTHFAHQAAA